MCTDLHRYWISEYVFKAGYKNSDGLLTYEEFKAAVASFGQQQGVMQARQDPAAIPKADRDTLRMLHDYLSENEDVLKKYFESADQGKNGTSPRDHDGQIEYHFSFLMPS